MLWIVPSIISPIDTTCLRQFRIKALGRKKYIYVRKKNPFLHVFYQGGYSILSLTKMANEDSNSFWILGADRAFTIIYTLEQQWY